MSHSCLKYLEEMENNWVYIDEAIKLSKLFTLNVIKELHVDTRSFSCLLL